MTLKVEKLQFAFSEVFTPLFDLHKLPFRLTIQQQSFHIVCSMFHTHMYRTQRLGIRELKHDRTFRKICERNFKRKCQDELSKLPEYLNESREVSSVCKKQPGAMYNTNLGNPRRINNQTRELETKS